MKYEKCIKAVGLLGSQLKFLAKAVSSDRNRPALLRYIYIEPSKEGSGQLSGYATDGMRLHVIDPIKKSWVNAFGLTTGYWKPIQNYGKESDEIMIARINDSDVNFYTILDWRKPISKEVPEFITGFNGFSINGLLHGDQSLASFYRIFPKTTDFNFKYLLDLGTETRWVIKWYGPEKAVQFIEYDGNRMAVIMPINIDKEAGNDQDKD